MWNIHSTHSTTVVTVLHTKTNYPPECISKSNGENLQSELHLLSTGQWRKSDNKKSVEIEKKIIHVNIKKNRSSQKQHRHFFMKDKVELMSVLFSKKKKSYIMITFQFSLSKKGEFSNISKKKR